jgi:hypothetical protein
MMMPPQPQSHPSPQSSALNQIVCQDRAHAGLTGTLNESPALTAIPTRWEHVLMGRFLEFLLS